MATSCVLDVHPLIKDINEWLRSEDPETGKPYTYGAIRAFLLERGAPVPERYSISRHKAHLGLPSRAVVLPLEEEKESDVREVAKLSLKEFHRRLLHDSKNVTTRDLIPFIQLLLKESEGSRESDALGEAMKQLENAENS